MNPYEFDRRIALGQVTDLLPSFPNFFPSQKTPLVMAGVDEAGRGPLAGPVVAAAVVLPSTPRIKDLNDSKKLTAPKREELFDVILEVALSSSISIISHQMIDATNILAAALEGMRDAVKKLKIIPQLVLVDGNQKPHCGLPELAIIKGDGLSAAIMAASILAKVTRDRIMVELHEKYPQYGFDTHKGYGAATHLEAIRKHGPSPVHRMSFEPLKSMKQEGLCLKMESESLEKEGKISRSPI